MEELRTGVQEPPFIDITSTASVYLQFTFPEPDLTLKSGATVVLYRVL
jgi:hypothetical protein